MKRQNYSSNYTISLSFYLSTLLIKRLQHRCFLVDFAKNLRIPFLQNTSAGCSCSVEEAEAYSEPSRTSKMELFVKIAIHYILTGFSMCFREGYVNYRSLSFESMLSSEAALQRFF